MFQCFGTVGISHPLHCIITFTCHLSVSQRKCVINNIAKSQYSQTTSAPRRSSPSPHHQFSCVSGSHWRNWKKRGCTCTCLILPLSHRGASVPFLCDPALKSEMRFVRIQILDPFPGVPVAENDRWVPWRAGVAGWWGKQEDSCLSLG